MEEGVYFMDSQLDKIVPEAEFRMRYTYKAMQVNGQQWIDVRDAYFGLQGESFVLPTS